MRRSDVSPLRYDLEDIVRWNTKPCPCGDTHRRLFYEGRVRDLVPAGTREVLPIDVALVLYESPEVSTPSAEYQIVRSTPPCDRLHVRVEYDPAQIGDVTGIADRLAGCFRDGLGVATELIDPDETKASRAKTRRRKEKQESCYSICDLVTASGMAFVMGPPDSCSSCPTWRLCAFARDLLSYQG